MAPPCKEICAAVAAVMTHIQTCIEHSIKEQDKATKKRDAATDHTNAAKKDRAQAHLEMEAARRYDPIAVGAPAVFKIALVSKQGVLWK